MSAKPKNTILRDCSKCEVTVKRECRYFREINK